MCSSDLDFSSNDGFFERRGKASGGGRAQLHHAAFAGVKRRSEERRVGKEGRSRWAPDH